MWEYVNRFAACSQEPEHEVILECLDYYGAIGTQELTLEQAAEWWELFVR